MCIFSGAVTRVSSTSIFARSGSKGSQFLAYEMTVGMTESVAMVLPLPISLGAGDDDLRFIDLSPCGDFFEQLSRAFPEPVSNEIGADREASLAVDELIVHEVGAFDASFVPTMKDFERLDPGFRLSDKLWSELPQYADYGFAVFALTKRSEWKPAHPIAFEFPRRDNRLFFPTVHVHEGVVHARAEFDHALYAQVGDGSVEGWRASEQRAHDIVRCADDGGLLDPTLPVLQRKMRGVYDNDDVWI